MNLEILYPSETIMYICSHDTDLKPYAYYFSFGSKALIFFFALLSLIGKVEWNVSCYINLRLKYTKPLFFNKDSGLKIELTHLTGQVKSKILISYFFPSVI